MDGELGELKLVIDTNVLFAAAVHPGGSRRLLDDIFARPDWRWIATESILREYRKVLAHVRFRLSPEELAAFNARIEAEVERVEAGSEITLPADPSDAKFLNCASEAGAHFLITSDHHLLEAEPPPGTRVLTVADFYVLCNS
ncbi:MAG: putative toxin-antitoxin system toxin component, PIN family [Sumerlaeia bacterium]